MIKFRSACLVIPFLLVIIGACEYHNEEDLYPDNNQCQTIDVSYSQRILPILENNCYRCHDIQNRQGNVTLEEYNNLIIYVNNGRLLGAIKRESGFTPMPQDGPQLDDCIIAQIEAWVNEWCTR